MQINRAKVRRQLRLISVARVPKASTTAKGSQPPAQRPSKIPNDKKATVSGSSQARWDGVGRGWSGMGVILVQRCLCGTDDIRDEGGLLAVAAFQNSGDLIHGDVCAAAGVVVQ